MNTRLHARRAARRALKRQVKLTRRAARQQRRSARQRVRGRLDVPIFDPAGITRRMFTPEGVTRQLARRSIRRGTGTRTLASILAGAGAAGLA